MKCVMQALCVVVAGLMVCVGTMLADEPAAGGGLSEPFVGKIVTVYTSAQGERGFVLTDVKLETIGGRMFMVGIGADTGAQDDWTKGLVISVAWDAVTTYMPMTPEQFKELAARRNAK